LLVPLLVPLKGLKPLGTMMRPFQLGGGCHNRRIIMSKYKFGDRFDIYLVNLNRRDAVDPMQIASLGFPPENWSANS
jgi:hypothetical protein